MTAFERLCKCAAADNVLQRGLDNYRLQFPSIDKYLNYYDSLEFAFSLLDGVSTISRLTDYSVSRVVRNYLADSIERSIYWNWALDVTVSDNPADMPRPGLDGVAQCEIDDKTQSVTFISVLPPMSPDSARGEDRRFPRELLLHESRHGYQRIMDLPQDCVSREHNGDQPSELDARLFQHFVYDFCNRFPVFSRKVHAVVGDINFSQHVEFVNCYKTVGAGFSESMELTMRIVLSRRPDSEFASFSLFSLFYEFILTCDRVWDACWRIQAWLDGEAGLPDRSKLEKLV